MNSNTTFKKTLGKGYSTGIFLVIIIAVALFFSMQFSTVSVADPTSNVTVDVNVTTLGEIKVSPQSINWTTVIPGQIGGQRNLSIKNTGSVNVTNIFAYISTLENESTRPYGSSNPASYSAGGLLVFHNESNTTMAWAGRLEWNWTESINNLGFGESTISANTQSASGFFRNASTAFIWIVKGNTTNGRCNETGTILAIEDDNDDGTTNTRSPNATQIVLDNINSEFGVFSVNRGTNFLNDMCIAVNKTCDKIFVYKYDRRSIFPACNNAQYISANLAPNDVEEIVAEVFVPKGLPSGNLTQAIWYFIGTAS